MWVDEMKEIERRHYGFIRLVPSDLKKLGLKPTNRVINRTELCESCKQYLVSYKHVLLNTKNSSLDKRWADLCEDCKSNNSSGRRIPTEWAVHQC